MIEKMQPQECQRNGLPAALIRPINRRYCGNTCWRRTAGETSVLVLKTQIVAEAADGERLAESFQQSVPTGSA